MRKRRLIILCALLPLIAIALANGLSSTRHYLERRAASIQCRHIMGDIELCARLWANEHDRTLPPNLLRMSNELVSPKILRCPADRSRVRVRSWEEFIESNSSYEVLSASVHDTDTNTPYLRCKVHGYVGYAQATVRTMR